MINLKLLLVVLLISNSFGVMAKKIDTHKADTHSSSIKELDKAKRKISSKFKCEKYDDALLYVLIYMAVKEADNNKVQCLVEQGVNLNDQDWDEEGEGVSVLMYATLYANLNMVKYLVEKGADINDKFVNYAKWSGHLDIAKYLKEQLAKENSL
jgi:ankyrin repeat protein